MVPVSDQDMNTHLAEVSRVRLCIIYTNLIIQNNCYFIWFLFYILIFCHVSYFIIFLVLFCSL